MIRNYLSKNLTCVCALPAALLCLPPGKSLLHRWQNPDGSFKYRELCSIKGSNPIAPERDCKVVAILMAELFSLDSGRDVKEGYETDLLRNNGKPLAFSSTTRPCTASWGCSSGRTFGSLVPILVSSVNFFMLLTGPQLTKWLAYHSFCMQNLNCSGLFCLG